MPGANSGPVGGGARDLAERTAKAFEHLSSAEIGQVSCSPSVGKELSKPFSQLPPGTSIKVTVEQVDESGSDATA